MRKSFVEEVFKPKYYEKLEIRKNTFLEFFQRLEKLELDYYVLVETGTSRAGLSDIAGNGAVTYLFDEFVNFYDGKVFSFDITKSSCTLVDSTTSDKTRVICVDSLAGINNLKLLDIYDINGVYLDSVDSVSVDTNFIADEPCSSHALKELINSIYYFTEKTIIMVDDTPSSIDFLPPWVKNDPARGQNQEYLSKLSFPSGKGRQIIDYVNKDTDYTILKHEYQVVIEYSKDSNKVPELIHQTWKTREIDFTVFNKDYVDSWKKHHPTHEIICHSDSDNRTFIKNYYPWFLTIYDSYPKEICREDAVRYFYLLHYGGIYTDLNFECKKSIIPYLKESINLVELLNDTSTRGANEPDKWISNAFMTSAPRHIFWKRVICRGLMRNYKNKSVIHATGQMMLSSVYYNSFDFPTQNFDLTPKHESIYMLPSKLFYPINYRDYTQETVGSLSDDVVTIHHYANSCNISENEKIQLKFIGQKGQDDWVIDQIFNYKQYGYFVDLAATDGVAINNTLLLEKELNWYGICIEPNPYFYNQLKQNRKCIVTDFVVDKDNDIEIDFRVDNGELGGIVDEDTDNNHTYRDDQLKRATIIKLKTKTLEYVLDKFNAPKVIDYLSLDIEGAEERVLSEFPFNKYTFLAMTIERPTPELEKVLFDNGYVFVMVSKKLPFDTFYVHKTIPNFDQIVKEPYTPTPRKDW